MRVTLLILLRPAAVNREQGVELGQFRLPGSLGVSTSDDWW